MLLLLQVVFGIVWPNDHLLELCSIVWVARLELAIELLLLIKQRRNNLLLLDCAGSLLLVVQWASQVRRPNGAGEEGLLLLLLLLVVQVLLLQVQPAAELLALGQLRDGRAEGAARLAWPLAALYLFTIGGENFCEN